MTAPRRPMPSPALRWIPPAVLVAFAAAVHLAGLNDDLFLILNRWSAALGDRGWACVTALGDGLVAAAFMLPWIRRNPRLVLAVGVGLLLSTAIGQSIKYAVAAPRPLLVLPPDLVHLIGPSLRFRAFPSGHAATAFAVAGGFAFTAARRRIGWAVLAPAVLIAISRSVAGVHWPTDIAVGGAIGWLSVQAGAILADRALWARQGTGLKVLGGIFLGLAALLLFFDATECGVMTEQRLFAAALLLIGGREYSKLFRREAAPSRSA